MIRLSYATVLLILLFGSACSDSWRTKEMGLEKRRMEAIEESQRQEADRLEAIRIENERLRSKEEGSSTGAVAADSILRGTSQDPKLARIPGSPRGIRVFYATDRDSTDSEQPSEYYGIDRGELVYGTAVVSIPPNHETGVIERPSIWFLEFHEDVDKHVVLVDVTEQDKDDFFASVREKIATSPRSNVFIFVHGFNVTFEAAAHRTAQMTHDLDFHGAPIFYSWPSQGGTLPYVFDKNNIQWTQYHLENFLVDVTDRTESKNIYLIAHSMGAEALTRAFANVVRDNPALRERFREIILTAPDIDAEIFMTQIAPRMIAENTHITLYASANDNALIASKAINGLPRAGDAGAGLVIFDGIETIDASNVETDLLGHSYFEESVLSDMFYIFRYGTRPDDRFLLRRQETSEGSYWKFGE